MPIRMQNMSKKDSDQSSVHSTSPCGVNCPSWWNSSGSQIPQSSLTKSLNLKTNSPTQHCYHAKQLGLQLQDQESSSTQSTGQSHHEVAVIGGGNPHGQCFSAQSGYDENYGKRVEGHVMKSVVSLGAPDFVFPTSQVDCSQSVAHIAYPYADPYFGGVLAAYGPQAIIHPQMVGMAPARVPLPLDLAEDGPIYVNAKQYRGILRRRQYRAKQEAQNKLVKDRKPYLHESRHLHAMKRARGSGGRFLNTKQLQQSKSTLSTDGQSGPDTTALLQLGRNLSESNTLQSENGNAANSVTSCSEVTSISNGDDMFQKTDLRFSGIRLHMDGSVQGGNRIMHNGSQHRVSVIR
eukprot:TRINITY_DN4338_c0_g1_i2.p1 TRINITY_DN4338_c0_g1~~TRINITY_DN4338_c0_g1_i2.p1  ORF type:complete len:349 (-),score=52.69 TRINITY_DN4338_c0_g1_i2:318-1364(-)